MFRCASESRKIDSTQSKILRPDADAAIRKAIEDYGITDPHRQRRLDAQPIE